MAHQLGLLVGQLLPCGTYISTRARMLINVNAVKA